MVVVLVSLLIGAVTLVYLLIRLKYSYWKSRGIPYLEPIFPFGNFKGIRTKIHMNEILQKAYDKEKGISIFCGMFMFLKPILIPIDLNLIKNILIKDFNYFTDRGFYCNEEDDPLSGHLFMLDGEAWKTMRTKLSPTFTSGKIKNMFPMVVHCGNQFETILSETITKDPIVEMRDFSARFTIDVIGACAFGFECNSLKNPKNIFRRTGIRIFSEQRHGLIGALFMTNFPEAARKLKMKVLPDDISEFFMNIVKQTVEYRERTNVRRNDFIDLLIDLKNSDQHFTLGQIAAQAFVFFFAGFESTSTTMAYCLYELAFQQDIQDKVRKDILSVLDEQKGALTYEAMSKMKYLDKVLNETLRKYPAAANLIRQTVKDYKIENTSYVIEKGTLILIPVYAIHHDPEYYPQPNTFSPERFDPESFNQQHPCSYLPFGDGPRNCIGLRFAKMVAFVGLVTLLSKFKFLPCDKTQKPIVFDPRNVLLGPKDGIYLKMEKINNS